jgi:hypothetical protein
MREDPRIQIQKVFVSMCLRQCCGSGSVLIWLSWVRIRIWNADPESRSMDIDKFTNKPGFLPFKKFFYLLRYRYFFDLFPVPTQHFQYIFHVKLNFCDFEV